MFSLIVATMNTAWVLCTRFTKFEIGDAAGKDLDALVVNGLENQFVKLVDNAAVGIDLVVGGLEEVLYQRRTTVACGTENGVGLAC
jgi:hypothetical protein